MGAQCSFLNSCVLKSRFQARCGTLKVIVEFVRIVKLIRIEKSISEVKVEPGADGSCLQS
jgi:hypothetical protein